MAGMLRPNRASTGLQGLVILSCLALALSLSACRSAIRMDEAGDASTIDESGIYRYHAELDYFIDERSRINFFQKLGDFFERHLKPDPAHLRRPGDSTAS